MDLLIDLSVKVTRQADKDAHGNEKQASFGHLGTHFDVMDKEFPLAFTRREGIAFDVSGVEGRDIGTRDVDLSPVEAGMFAAFRTGFIEREPYGTRAYFTGHPQLSDALIDALRLRKFAGVGLDVYEDEDEQVFEDFSDDVLQNEVVPVLLSFPNVVVGRRRRGLSHGPSRSILTG